MSVTLKKTVRGECGSRFWKIIRFWSPSPTRALRSFNCLESIWDRDRKLQSGRGPLSNSPTSKSQTQVPSVTIDYLSIWISNQHLLFAIPPLLCLSSLTQPQIPMFDPHPEFCSRRHVPTFSHPSSHTRLSDKMLCSGTYTVIGNECELLWGRVAGGVGKVLW